MSDEERDRWTVPGETGEALLFVIVILGIVAVWKSELFPAVVALFT